MSMMIRLLVALRAPSCCGLIAAVLWASAGAAAREPTRVPPDDEPIVTRVSATVPEGPGLEEGESEVATEAPATEDLAAEGVYYLAIFSSQSIPKVPNRTHNWSVAVRGEMTDGDIRVVDVQTIS